MRSSKSRSRNKSRNQRSLGNVVNRVFDSSGPEGKVRGTPQQIIEKYLALARDAQLSNDRVAEQSFLQHAEHYTRMLGDAQREQAERQAQFGSNGSGEDRDERPNNYVERRDDNRGDNRGDNRRDDGRRDDRRDDNRRDDNRRDERRDEPRRDDRRDDNRRDERRERPARDQQVEVALIAPDEPMGHDALPDFLRAAPVGIPEALPISDETGPVETPEAKAARVDMGDVADDVGAEAARPRRRAAAPRRAPARKRSDAAPVEDGDLPAND